MDIRQLSSVLQQKAQEELNEVPGRVLDDLKDIEEWLSKQPHLNVRKGTKLINYYRRGLQIIINLVSPKIDRQWLLAFLRSSKFSLQRAKEKLDYFYTIKSITPEYFTNKDPMRPEIQEIIKAGAVISITKSTDAAVFPSILFVNWKYCDPNKMMFTDLFKVGLMNMDVLLNQYDNCTVNGVYILHDMTGFSLSYMTHITPTLCKKAMLSITKAYPSRIKGIYFMNTPSLYEIFINMFIPFLSEKMKKRFKIFGENSFDKLLEEIPLSILPKDYGGEGQPLKEITAEWKQVMENNTDWFLEDAQYCSDETKRPGKPKTSADIFGVEGSFRKLNVD